MTTPAVGGIAYNTVVGADPADFLRLGLHTGFFPLEQLAGSPGEFRAAHPFAAVLASGRPDPDLSAWEVAALAQLARTFGLTPWARVGERLA